MANFAPLKMYILASLDELINDHHLTGPFLDVGCGRGDVAAHLASRGWAGKAIDLSPTAAEAARLALHNRPLVQVANETIEAQQNGCYNTVIMLDVLEHIRDDRAALEAIAALQPAGAALVLVVPSNPDSEWRWDDDWYGHFRRYHPEGMVQLLADTGYHVVTMWDITFPIFWMMRRGYTALKRRPQMPDGLQERTQQSVFRNAWDMGILSRLLNSAQVWAPIFALQRRLRQRADRGHEIIVLAQRS